MEKSFSLMLANLYALYLKTQNFHWNVVGGSFYSLHKLFEGQYEEMAESIDEVAERMRSLGFYVEASFSAFAKLTQVSEPKERVSAEKMIQELIDSQAALIKQMNELMSLAEEKKDGGTLDLLGRMLGSHEKQLWMLKSQLPR